MLIEKWQFGPVTTVAFVAWIASAAWLLFRVWNLLRIRTGEPMRQVKISRRDYVLPILFATCGVLLIVSIARKW